MKYGQRYDIDRYRDAHRKSGVRGLRTVRRAILAAFLSVSLLMPTGCGAGYPFDLEDEASGGYTKAQAMIVVTTERNRYEHAYTDQIWDVEMEDGETFETYLLGQVREFLVNLRTLNCLAEDRGIVLTSAEQNRLQALAEQYYEGLTESDIGYMGIAEEDVLAMYREYYLADKLVSDLTKGIDLEVSDSEAKVISVNMIQISGREAAEAVYRRVSQDGADFLSIARETSEGETAERQLGRGEEPKAVEDAAFALAPGEMSGLIESGGWYYIIQCVSDYEEEATQLRKTRIREERKNQVFRQIISQYGMEEQVIFTEDFWPEIHFSADDGTTASNFFSLYQEEFGGQGV